MAKFGGAMTALVTPMHEDESVDYEGFRALVKRQLEGGIDGILPLGTTAETPTLTEDEEDEIIKIAFEEVRAFEKATGKKILVTLGAGSNCTRDAVRYCERAKKAGADAALAVTPYYNKPSQEGIFKHFEACSKVGIPIVVYNIQGRTSVNIATETLLKIADLPNVIAVKEASGNITQMDDIIKNKPENFDVISGDDGITFPLITLGAVGVISVIGNAFPREFSRMTRLALQGDYNNALTIHHKFTELFSLLFVDGNPAGVKAMLNMMGMIENKLRLPLVPAREVTCEQLQTAWKSLKF